MRVNITGAIFSNDIPDDLKKINRFSECDVRCKWQIRRRDHEIVRCRLYIPEKSYYNENGLKLKCILKIKRKENDYNLSKYEKIVFGIDKYVKNMKVCVYEVIQNSVIIEQ